MKKIMPLAVLLLTLIGCKESAPKKQAEEHLVVKREAVQKSLFFTGTIQPLQENAITSPMDSVIETMHVHYGERVKRGDIILTLNSSELQRQYNDTLTDYLKAKDNFSMAVMKFNGTKQLWNAGLISKNNFQSEKSNLDSARVTLMQATRKLNETLDKMDDGDKEQLRDLSLAEFDKVREVLTRSHNLIHLRAPEDGVLLYPPKTTEDKSAHPAVGSTLKAGQVFALVGDVSGVKVEIDVPEIDIASIHPGMKARITGVALGKVALPGELLRVNAQALSSSGTAQPSFSAVVVIQSLTPQQQSLIKVGMSASIELMVEGEKELWIPMQAVVHEHQKTMVKIYEKGQVRLREIEPGAVYEGKVAVLKGLEEGQTVVL